MDWHAIVGIIAGIVQAISIIPYINDMLRGRTRPNIVTWFLWTVIQLIVIAAQFSAGASWSVIILIVMTFNTSLVLVLCLKGYGYKKYSWIDYICFFVAALAIVLWQITKEPTLAIVLAVLADFISLVPTIVKTYREPHSEMALAWFLNVIAGALAAISVTKVDVANLIFPIYYVATDLPVAVMAFRGQRKLGRG